MAGVTYWNGTSEIPVTLTRWDGTNETPLTAYQWNGTSEVPLFDAAPTDAFIGSSAVSHAAGSSGTSIPVPIPSGVESSDVCVLMMCNSNSAATITSVTGCSALLSPTDTGSMQAAIYSGTGHTAGGTVTVAGTNFNPSAVTAVWYRGLSLGSLATPATRGGTVFTSTASAAPGATGTNRILVMVAEKSGSNTDNIAPVVPSVTQRAWAPWNSSATGMPSAYIGEYTAPGGSKTATYLRSSANGLATQVRLFLP